MKTIEIDGYYIEYRYEDPDGGDIAIDMSKSEINRARGMLNEGCDRGKLRTKIYLDSKDEKKTEIRGWWKIRR